MKVVCIVQARTTSERFPCKIFAALHGRPMLLHVLERAATIEGIDQVVLAVPENDVRLVAHLWQHVFGGSEKDVLGRYVSAAGHYAADMIVRITGDCPLLAPDLATVALREAIAQRAEYTALCQPYANMADGWDVEICSRNALVNANRHANKEQREHVTTYLRKTSNVMSCSYSEDMTALKCSVDTRQDLQRVDLIMQHLYDPLDFTHQATWDAWKRAGRP